MKCTLVIFAQNYVGHLPENLKLLQKFLTIQSYSIARNFFNKVSTHFSTLANSFYVAVRTFSHSILKKALLFLINVKIILIDNQETFR